MKGRKLVKLVKRNPKSSNKFRVQKKNAENLTIGNIKMNSNPSLTLWFPV